MTDEPRVQQLLDELLASDATPEAVCASCPELLPVVRKKWRRIRRLRADLDAVFPLLDEEAPPPEDTVLPQVPHHEVEQLLGRGGMGAVYRARHLSLNRPVALKMLLTGLYATRTEVKRFQREAEAVARLRHPNIVQVYEIGDVDGRPYFTMEFVEGGNLAQQIQGVPQPPRTAAALVATLADAVQVAHASGIVHRDLKPSNILLTADRTPKLTDFGLASRQDGGEGLTLTGVPVGTPSYMAPCQARGDKRAIGPATDVYALGAILYELLTGRPPFRGETAAATLQQVVADDPVPPGRLNSAVPRDLETICLKCLNKEPSRRYSTAAELAGDLLRFQRGEPIQARRAGPAERLVKWTRRHRSLAAALVSGILLLNVLVAVVVSALVDRSVLTRTVEADFREVVDAQQRQAWGDARNALERAKGRLRGGGPPEFHRRADQLERELALVATLQEIRLRHNDAESAAARGPRTTAAYEAAFREAGLLDGREDAELVVARIRATCIAPALLVALDGWAWNDKGRRDYLLELARRVEPNPTSRQVRDPGVWANLQALEELSRSMPVEIQTAPFLLLVAQRIQILGGNPIPFLKRVQRAHPMDFEVNYKLAHELLTTYNSPAEAIGYFRVAVALRPTLAMVRLNLAKALGDSGRGEDALGEIKAAVRFAAGTGYSHFFAGVLFYKLGRFDDAMPQLRKACELDPGNSLFLSGVSLCLAGKKQHAEAIEVVRKAIALDPKCWQAHQQLACVLLELGQQEKAHAAWRESLRLGAPNLESWEGYTVLSLFVRDEAEYRRARTELLKRFGRIADPRVAERVGRACLLLPASENELRQATSLIDRALTSERAKPGWLLPYFRFAKALAEYRAGRLESAVTLLDTDTQRILGPAPRLLLAMVQHRSGKADAARESFRAAAASYVWDAKSATDREAWMYHLLRREAETVLASKP
jgi:serine/threonine-protein kinase